MKKGLISIDKVVRSVIADEQRNTLHKYIWYLHYALDFVREFNIDYHVNIITCKVKVDENNTVCLPDDYVNFKSVGVKIGDRIMAYTQDTTLTIKTEKGEPNKKFANEYESKAPQTALTPYYFYNFKGDEEDKNLDVYLLGATYPGYFKIDHKTGRIQLSAEVNEKHVYLEYVSNGMKNSEMTIIPEIALDLAKTYIKWRYNRYKKGIDSASTQAWENEYSRVRSQFLVRKSNVSYQSILNAFKKNFSQKVMN